MFQAIPAGTARFAWVQPPANKATASVPAASPRPLVWPIMSLVDTPAGKDCRASSVMILHAKGQVKSMTESAGATARTVSTESAGPTATTVPIMGGTHRVGGPSHERLPFLRNIDRARVAHCPGFRMRRVRPRPSRLRPMPTLRPARPQHVPGATGGVGHGSGPPKFLRLFFPESGGQGWRRHKSCLLSALQAGSTFQNQGA